MTVQRRVHLLACILAALAAAMASSACVILPMRLTTRIEGPDRTKQKLPKSAIVPGKTTRQEVEAGYKGISVETGIPNLFWGRYRKSSWGVAVAGINPLGGSNDWLTDAYSGRLWGMHNLLVTFDANGVVASAATVPEKDLHRRLMGMAGDLAAPPLELSSPMLLEDVFPDVGDQGGRIEIELNDAGLSVTRYPPHASPDVPPPLPTTMALAADQVTAVGVGLENEVQPAMVRAAIFFAPEPKASGRLNFWTTPRSALVFLIWWAEVGKR